MDSEKICYLVTNLDNYVTLKIPHLAVAMGKIKAKYLQNTVFIVKVTI